MPLHDDSRKAVTLSSSSYTSSNPLWKATVNLPAGQAVQYKYILVDTDGSMTWEADPSRTYNVAESSANLTSANEIPTESWYSSGISPVSDASSGGSSSKSSNQTTLGSESTGGPQQVPPSYSVAPGDSALKPPMSQSPQLQPISPNPHELPGAYEARELPA
ncbi:starch binding domain-containing protein [Hypoxylon sp. NC0597]|nr:starch binding domain-containing protein [Hypoxylon sp. NC0597]